MVATSLNITKQLVQVGPKQAAAGVRTSGKAGLGYHPLGSISISADKARQTLLRVAAPERPAEISTSTQFEEECKSRGRIYEYTSAANPAMTPIPIDGFNGILHETGPTRIITCDLSLDLETPYPATSPNLLAHFVRVCSGEQITTKAVATSQMFYIIRGSGETKSEYGTVSWSQGDVVILPVTQKDVIHKSSSGNPNGAALYWVHDGPLLQYLGATPTVKKFEPTIFRGEEMTAAVMRAYQHPDSKSRNRIGVLLGNETTENNTKTMTHILWSLFNMLPAKHVQPAHKHSSTALDLAVYAPKGTYTMMAREIDSEGNLVDPIRVDWTTGGMFTTPPGYWHSHHNDSDEAAWVFPVQDAGLFTHQRTLDIRFAMEEAPRIRAGRQQGATFDGLNVKI